MTKTDKITFDGQESWSRTDSNSDDSPSGESAENADATPNDGSKQETKTKNDEATIPEGRTGLGVIQVNYTTTQNPRKQAFIHLFCRHPETDQTAHIKVKGFDPYFYVKKDQANGLEKDDDRVIDTGPTTETIRGTPVTKVTTDVPRSVGQMRNDFQHYEADILFPDRFLIDKQIRSGIHVPTEAITNPDSQPIVLHHSKIKPADVDATPRVHTVDIEVDDRNEFPEAEDAEEIITCIAAHDSFNDSYKVWYHNSDEVSATVPQEVVYERHKGEEDTVDIYQHHSEEELLEDYLSYIEATDPDILTAWNGNDFDLPYIINRIDNLKDSSNNLASERLSRVNEVWDKDGGYNGPNIKGRISLDLLDAYERTQFSELDSYRLEAVGQAELGTGKENINGDYAEVWMDDPEQLIKYNLKDVEICVELDREQEIIDFWKEVKNYVGCRLEDAPTPGDAVDMFVLQNINGQFVLPTKGHVESGDEYEGGAVFEPQSTILEYIVALDLKSLYPMIMCTVNASPETKVDPETYDGDTYVAPNGTHFQKEQDGIIREMVNELLDERDHKKELRDNYHSSSEEYDKYDRQQGAIKVIMNSLYGTLGWDRFRLYDNEMAAAVTAIGRDVIEFTEQVVNERGVEVAYGDTDSVLVDLSDTEVDPKQPIPEDLEEAFPQKSETTLQKYHQVRQRGVQLGEHINDRYNDYARNELNAEDHRLLIEFESIYRRYLQAGKKKRYSGKVVNDEGNWTEKLSIKGFEFKRSDTAPVTANFQYDLLEMLTNGNDEDTIREELHSRIKALQNGEVPIEDVAIPGGINKEIEDYETKTAHVRGAEYANMLFDKNFGKGSKPKRLYLSRVDPRFYESIDEDRLLDEHKDLYREFKRNPDVICFVHPETIPDEFEVDWDKMLNKVLRGPISRVLEATDMSWEDLKSNQEQTGLGSFV